MQPRSRWALGALGVLAVAVAAVVVVRFGWAPFAGTINALHVALDAPDAYISTPALSRLPRDLVKAPLARELLTEEFAFYYEEHEDRLGLAGALKRIAYEHDMTLADQLIELSLDEPAEVALWTDAKGAPRYWLIAMTRGLLAKTLQQLGPIAASDTQLSAIGELPGASGATPVYALQLSPRRTLAFVARGNRVVVLSDPGLLFDAEHKADKTAAKTVAALLSGDADDQNVYRRRFGLGAPGADHVLVADSSLLSFGYRHFFPGLRGLQIDVSPNGGALRTLLRVDAQALPTPAAASALWAGLPVGAAACSWLPADWTRAQAVLDGIGAAKPDAADATTPQASVGTTPVPAHKEAAHGKTDTSADGSAVASEDRSTETPTAKATGQPAVKATEKPTEKPTGRPTEQPTEQPTERQTGRPKAATATPSDATKAAWDRFVATLDGPAAVCWYARSQLHTPLLVARTRADAPAAATDEALARMAAWLLPDGGIELPPGREAGARRWQAEVPAPYGPNGDEEDSLYKPTLSHAGAWISFSPDDQLVELALAAQGRRYPGIADTLPAEGTTLAVVAPRSLADLLQQEADAVLPSEQELFHQAAETYLAPRLDTLRRWPAVRATPVGSPSADGWVVVDWQPLVPPRSGDAAAVAPRAGPVAPVAGASRPGTQGAARSRPAASTP